MAASYDVVIAGAGIIGLSIARQLARRSSLSIAVIDKGAGVGEGSTGASTAVCRYRYSRDEVVYLARDGIHAYRQWPEFTGLAEPRAEFQQDGVLWLPGADTAWAPRESERMQGLGIESEVLDADELERRFPAISPSTLAPDFETGEPRECTPGGQAFFEPTGGYIDPVSAAQDLVDACRRSGVDVFFKAPAAGIDMKGGRVCGITLGNGDSLSTPLVINAAGPWCHSLYREAGLEIGWDLAPVRIQVLHRDRPDELEGHIPVTVDMAGGIYFRTQNRGQQLVVGSVLEEDEQEVVDDPDNYRNEPDEAFELMKLHALHHRLPKLPYRGRVMGYCGLYTVNRNDVHPILGPTNVEGFWVANGFSGHGFKLAPAIGAMIARELTGEADDFDTNVPMAFLGIGREPIVLDAKSVLA